MSHAVTRLNENPKALCAGSSEMYIYFKHIEKMYKFGPYGPNHSPAATFAFRKELLKHTSFDNNACVAEEKHFLKNYTIPFVQLDPMKSILVFSHNHNSYDKKDLLLNPNPTINISEKTVNEFMKNDEIKTFFLHDIDKLLENYEPGRPENKPDVSKQIKEIKERREEIIRNEMLKRENNRINMNNASNYENKITDLTLTINELNMENKLLHDKVAYLENKIKELIQAEIKRKKETMPSKED